MNWIKNKYFLLLFTLYTLLFTIGCNKTDDDPTIKWTYEVVMVGGNKIDIEYNSDLYTSTGTRKKIVYENNEFQGRYWRAVHYAKKSEGYYINVNYTKIDTSDKTKYQVNLYIGVDSDKDTLFATVTDKNPILIEGIVN